MAKKYTKKANPKTKNQKGEKKDKKTKKTNLPPKSEIQKKEEHHKFIIQSGLIFEDIVIKVIPLQGGKYGVLTEGGEFVIFSINNKEEIKTDISFNIICSNSFCQLGNGKFVFNSFNYVSLWELNGSYMNKLGEYQTIFGVAIYSMEPIGDNYCAISGPKDIIELVQFTNGKKFP